MTRKRRTTAQRLAIFTGFNGACHICQGKITIGQAWELEHIIPIAQGGDDGGDNLQPAHAKCHKGKTAIDAGNTARAVRREASHNGATAPRQKLQSAGFRKVSSQRTATRPLTKTMPERRI